MNDKRTFFTDIPYKGYYKYRDQFLIYPAAIELEGYINHIPTIIEFSVEEAKPEFYELPDLPLGVRQPVRQSFVQNQYNQHRFNEILRLLSLLTNYYHFTYTPSNSWFVEIEPEPSFPPIKWGQAMTPDIDENDCKPANKEVEERDSVKYYGDNFIQKKSHFVTYPDSIEQLLDKYYKLPGPHKCALYKSIKLFNQGLELKHKMPSMAIVAFISAIENVITYDNTGKPEDTCQCGEIKYGVTRKFKTFVGNYIAAESNTQRKKYVNDIYNLRSKIVHAGGLHVGDLDSNFWEYPKVDDLRTLEEIEQIARVSIINWFKNK